MYMRLLKYGQNVTENAMPLLYGLLFPYANFWRHLTVSNLEITNLNNRVRKNVTQKCDVNVMYGAVRNDPTLYFGRTDTYRHPKILADESFEADLFLGKY